MFILCIHILYLIAHLTENDISSQIISEEKLIFGLHAHAVSLMTVAKIRKVYNKLDSKSIAKQVLVSRI